MVRERRLLLSREVSAATIYRSVHTASLRNRANRAQAAAVSSSSCSSGTIEQPRFSNLLKFSARFHDRSFTERADPRNYGVCVLDVRIPTAFGLPSHRNYAWRGDFPNLASRMPVAGRSCTGEMPHIAPASEPAPRPDRDHPLQGPSRQPSK